MEVPLCFFVWTQHTPLSPCPSGITVGRARGLSVVAFGFPPAPQSPNPETQKAATGNPSASRGSDDPPAIIRPAWTFVTLPATGLRSFALALGGVSPARGVGPRWTVSPCLT